MSQRAATPAAQPPRAVLLFSLTCRIKEEHLSLSRAYLTNHNLDSLQDKLYLQDLAYRTRTSQSGEQCDIGWLAASGKDCRAVRRGVIAECPFGDDSMDAPVAIYHLSIAQATFQCIMRVPNSGLARNGLSSAGKCSVQLKGLRADGQTAFHRLPPQSRHASWYKDAINRSKKTGLEPSGAAQGCFSLQNHPSCFSFDH